MEETRRIKIVCDERGIKLIWLAAQLGISDSYLSQIIGGTRPAPRLFYEKVAGLLNVSIERVRPVAESVPA